MINELYQPEKVLIFDIKGPYAHFKKFYTNSSSLSYTVPPRTVIAGIIAGILGLPSEQHTENNSEIYYEKFLTKNSFITVSLVKQTRKIMQTINYYNLKFQNYSLRYQVPVEIIVPIENEITYRIYFSHNNINLYDELKNRLIQKQFFYPPFLGLSEFIADIDFIGESKVKAVKAKVVDSVCKLSFINELNTNSEFKYMTETMPVYFDNNRNPGAPEEYIIEVTGNKINADFKDNALIYSISYYDNNKQITQNISPM